MIVVKSMSGQTKIKVTGLYQWDQLQTLQFADEYPNGTEVHFAIKDETVALVYLLENGSVRIPSVLLQRALPVMAWVHVGETTVLEIEMPVTPRAMPSDYMGIEDNIQHSIEYRTIKLEQWQVEAINQMSDRYTKAETDQKLNLKADANRVYTKLEANTLLNGKADSSDLALKADKTYVDNQDATLTAELAEKASVEDVALKADKTYVDSKDALKADKTEVTALANKVPSTKELVTVTGKNQYFPIIMDSAGEIIGRYLPQVWDGSAFVLARSLGVGVGALSSNTGAYSNGFGYNSLFSNTGAYSNGFGNSALQNNTGAYSNGLGNNSLFSNTGAYSNGFGYNSLFSNTGAYSNGFGYQSLFSNTGAYSNGFGYNSLFSNTGAQSNGLGNNSLFSNTGAYSNGFGHNSLFSNTGAYSNGLGNNSLFSNTGAYSNGFGNSALQNNTGANNTALGYNSFNAFVPNSAGAKSCEYTAIDTTLKRATVTSHGFGANGTYTLVNYSTTGTTIGGMSAGTVQIKIIDANTIEFVTGSALRNITSQGTGTHTFTPSMNYSNTTSLGANTEPNRSNQVVLGSTSVNSFRLGGTFRTPASSSDTGAVGEFCYDSNYVYLCTAVNTWKRVALGGGSW